MPPLKCKAFNTHIFQVCAAHTSFTFVLYCATDTLNAKPKYREIDGLDFFVKASKTLSKAICKNNGQYEAKEKNML